MKNTFVFLVLLACNIQLHAQDYSKAFAAADTSRFAPNKGQGWQLFNSYVNSVSKDTAIIELIIQHSNNFDFTVEQYIGEIKDSSLIPSFPQMLLFHVLNDDYLLKIDNKGKCFIRFVGEIPSSVNPILLPLKVFYKL